MARPARFGETDREMLEEGVMVSVRATDLLWLGLLESTSINVSAVPEAAVVGVPVIAPVAPFKDRPAGRVPLIRDHVYGVVPPVAVRFAL
jgi:hypothetical protein